MAIEHITGIIGGVDWTLVRRHPRYQIDVAVRVTFIRDGEKIVFNGRGSELSEGGMAAYIATALEVGDRLTIETILPYSREQIAVDAVVRSKSGFRYGMEFRDLTVLERQLILRACTALSLLK